MCTNSLSRGEEGEGGADNPSPSSTQVKERVAQYPYSLLCLHGLLEDKRLNCILMIYLYDYESNQQDATIKVH
jgi:hypothetical protein